MKLFSRHIAFMAILGTAFISCSPKPFLPENVGRENGNPKIPLVVSHLSEKNNWMVKRVKHHHNIFQRVLCFKYVCRAQIGRNNSVKTLSKKEFAKVIERNRERGFYDSVAPVPQPKKSKPIERDSLFTSIDTLVVDASQTKTTQKTDSLITLSEFLFETNSYKLQEEHLMDLDVLSDYLLANPALELTISGHTDNTGDEDRNLKLSARRAESVANYLVTKGFSRAKIVFKGLGSSQPVAGNETSAGRGKNRRVEILIRHMDR